MKKYLSTICLLLICISSYSQIEGKWRIIKYKPEASGLSAFEIKELYKEVIGKVILVDSTGFKYPRNILKGRFKEVRTVKIIEGELIPDSISYLQQYFCQELYYFGALTKKTINYLSPHYKNNTVRVYSFVCNTSEAIDCVDVFLLTKGLCGFCVAGDGLFLAEKIKR